MERRPIPWTRHRNLCKIGEAYVHYIAVGSEVLQVKTHHRQTFAAGETVTITIPVDGTIAGKPDAADYAGAGEDLMAMAGPADKREHGAHAR